MRKLIYSLIVSLIIISCGTQRQLQKAFVGKPASELEERFGTPKSVFEQNDKKIYVFEKEEKLRSTEINQGKLTLDPIQTPSAIKTERYYFTVNEGIIIEAKMEEEYVRR
jgi:hypothetical protein